MLAALAGSSGMLLAGPLALAAWLAGRRWQAGAARRPPDPRAVAFVVDLLAGALSGGVASGAGDRKGRGRGG